MLQKLIGKFKVDKLSGYQENGEKNSNSCIQCRRSKKKCTRNVTGCYNCLKYKRNCVYQSTHQVMDISAKLKPIEQQNISSLNPLNMKAPILNDSSFIQQSSIPSPSNDNDLESSFLFNTLGFSYLERETIKDLKIPYISKRMALNFIEAYFKHSHRSYPFICQAKFLQTFKTLERLSDTITTYLEFEIYMIMNIGCTTLSRAKLLEQGDVYSRYFSYKCTRFLLRSFNVDEFDSIKILLFFCIYSFFEPQGIHTWNLFGLVVRSATAFGLNQRLRTNEYTLEQVEMRNRLFWSIYNMDRLLSISLGRPLSIDEIDIDVEMPNNILGEDDFTFKTILAIIELRRIEGTITKVVYSVKSRDHYDINVTNEIQNKLDAWIEDHRPNTFQDTQFISFHGSDHWFYSRYYHNMMLLYRPSYLIPRPSDENLKLLSKSCLQSLSYTHKLFESNLLPLNWITLYRFLIVCSTTLYCLCNWGIDLNKSKVEIDLLIEILKAFSQNWIVASKCAEVFQNVVDNIFQIFLISDGHEVSNIKQLSSELLGASSAYHEILNKNSIEMSFTTMFQEELLTDDC